MTRDAAAALAPDFHLDQYFAATGSPSFSELNVSNPDFFKQVNGVVEFGIAGQPQNLRDWHLLRGAAPWLSEPFVEANFKMRQALTGQKEIQPRWKRCVELTDDALGEALGQKYVEVTFGAEGKQRMLKMVDALEKSLDEDIQGLPWMTEETKKQAKLKLQAIRNKIGYPDVWRDYSSLNMVRGDLLGNFLRANEFESKRQIAKIGKPLDRKEWDMTPPTVNAYYSPPYNEIVFPAGILQPPFFDKNMDDAVNYRRHRTGDRARVDTWLRRSGAQVRSAGQSARLVDCRKMARNSNSESVASPTSTAILSRSMISNSTAD